MYPSFQTYSQLCSITNASPQDRENISNDHKRRSLFEDDRLAGSNVEISRTMGPIPVLKAKIYDDHSFARNGLTALGGDGLSSALVSVPLAYLWSHFHHPLSASLLIDRPIFRDNTLGATTNQKVRSLRDRKKSIAHCHRKIILRTSAGRGRAVHRDGAVGVGPAPHHTVSAGIKWQQTNVVNVLI